MIGFGRVLAALALVAQLWLGGVGVQGGPEVDPVLAALGVEHALCGAAGAPDDAAGRHGRHDCAMCPLCAALAGPVAVLADGPALPEPVAGHRVLAGAAPQARAPPAAEWVHAFPRGPPILT